MSDEKIRFVRALQNTLTLVARCGSDLRSMSEVNAGRGYAAGGADPIIDADLTGTEVTAVEVADAITLADNLVKFLIGVAPTPTNKDYRPTMAKLRVDM